MFVLFGLVVGAPDDSYQQQCSQSLPRQDPFLSIFLQPKGGTHNETGRGLGKRWSRYFSVDVSLGCFASSPTQVVEKTSYQYKIGPSGVWVCT